MLAVHANSLVKDVKMKIINLSREYELNDDIHSKLDEHLLWTFDECNSINKLNSPGKMKRKYEELVLMEQKKWGEIDGVSSLFAQK